MSLLSRYKKIPSEFELLVSGYVNELELPFLIPVSVICWIIIYLISTCKKRLLTLNFCPYDIKLGGAYLLSWLFKMFTINKIYYKITFEIANFSINIYPQKNQYKINKGEFQSIAAIRGVPWHNNNSEGFKFLVQVFRSTMCKCSQSFIRIIINNQCKTVPSVDQNIQPFEHFIWSNDDAHIVITLNDKQLDFSNDDLELIVKFYNGDVNLHLDLPYQATLRSICCPIAGNERYIEGNEVPCYVMDELDIEIFNMIWFNGY